MGKKLKGGLTNACWLFGLTAELYKYVQGGHEWLVWFSVLNFRNRI